MSAEAVEAARKAAELAARNANGLELWKADRSTAGAVVALRDSALGYCVRPPALMLFRALLGDTADASAVALHATLDARYFTVRAERLLPYALCQVEVAPECDC